MRPIRYLSFFAGLTLLIQGAVRAQSLYKIQPIVKLGDKIGDAKFYVEFSLWVGSLNDNGQIVFVTRSAAGSPTLIQYAGGKFTPIVVAGQDGPIGKWPPFIVLWSPVSMNQTGDAVFSLMDQQGGAPLGTFRWDYNSRQVTPLALKGMPAVSGLTFVSGGGPIPVLNNHNDVAFVADVHNAAGETKSGVFWASQDGKLLPVALPDQALPDGGALQAAHNPSINDAGLVAFLTIRKGDNRAGAYVWEKGELTPVTSVGTDAPGIGKIASIWGVRLIGKNHRVLVSASIKTATAAHGLYMLADGRLRPVAVTGQEMPGGGTLQAIEDQISASNDAGQCAFLARLKGNVTAAYLVDENGKLSLILKSSATKELGQITRVGETTSLGIGLNNKGQVAVTVRISGSRDTLVLLTPQ